MSVLQKPRPLPTPEGLRLDDGSNLALFSGALNYWRHPADDWPRLLDGLVAIGIKLIDIYTPWSVHEQARGTFDFGELHHDNDLRLLFRLCVERGLYVFVRPGPHINSEMLDFGYPRRILDDPDIKAVTAWDTPLLHMPMPALFHVPSYASEAFYREVALWFDAIAPILREFQYPDGPLVALQIDNETCYFAYDSAYTLDYHPDSITLYQRWLAERYGTIETLNAVYKATNLSFEDIQPPREYVGQSLHNLPYYLDWTAFKEYQITWALKRLAAMWHERGLRLPTTFNSAFQWSSPIDLADLQANLDFVGIDAYAVPADYGGLKQMATTMCGMCDLPYFAEFGSGAWWSKLNAPTPDEQRFLILALLMHGIRGINFYMFIERDRWQAGPITRNGRPRAGFFDEHRHFFDWAASVEWPSYRKNRTVILLHSFDLYRFALAASDMNLVPGMLWGAPIAWDSRLDSQPGVERDLGFRLQIRESLLPRHYGTPFSGKTWLEQAARAFESLRQTYDSGDTHIPADRLGAYPMAFVLCGDFMPAAEQQKLLDYAGAGGQLVVGPVVPYLDEQMEPLSLLGEVLAGQPSALVGDGSIHVLEADALAAWVTATTPTSDVLLTDDRLEIVVHQCNGIMLIFVANPTDTPISATLSLKSGARLQRSYPTADHEAAQRPSVSLPPYTIEVWQAGKAT